MRPARIQFSIRGIMVAVALVAVYLAAPQLSVEFAVLLYVLTLPPILVTTIMVLWRSNWGPPASASLIKRLFISLSIMWLIIAYSIYTISIWFVILSR